VSRERPEQPETFVCRSCLHIQQDNARRRFRHPEIGSEENISMKRVFLSVALAGSIIAAGIPALAQQAATDSQSNTTAQQPETERHHHGGKHGDRMARMAEKLNLSQDQQDKLKPIFEKQRDQAQAIKNDNSLSQDQKKEKFQSLRQDTMAQVNGILTPEQQQQWQQMRDKHHHGKKGESSAQSTPQGQ
jgi:Spy/CpxP family protein refolding chaperone